MRKLLNLFQTNNSVFLWFGIFLFGVFILYTPPIDPDFGWHYRYGEYIFQNKEMLNQDIYSHTMTGHTWHNSYWVADVIIYLLYNNFGAVGLGLPLAVVLSSVLVFIFYKISFKKNGRYQFYSIVSLLVLLLFLKNYIVVVRPMFFSTLFMLLLGYTLLFSKKYIKYLPIMFLLWANMHADFTLGIFILGIYTLSKLYTALREGRVIRDFFAVSFFPLISLLITLVNPYGIELWFTLLNETHPFQYGVIQEFLPYSELVSIYSYYYFIFLVGLVIASLILNFKKYSSEKWYVFTVTFFALLSIRFSYFGRILMLLSIPLLLDFFEYTFSAVSFSPRNLLKIKLTLVLSFVLLVVTAFVLFVQDIIASKDISKWSYPTYPHDAVVYLKNNEYKGNILNDYSWGGYIILTLPEYKTFIDGRMPNWRNEEKYFFKEYIEFKRTPKNYTEYLHRYNIEVILTSTKGKFGALILKDPTWEKVYFDETAIVFVKKR